MKYLTFTVKSSCNWLSFSASFEEIIACLFFHVLHQSDKITDLYIYNVYGSDLQLEDNLEREKKVRADVEKVKRKLEQDLKSSQEAVEDLERIKRELEDGIKK